MDEIERLVAERQRPQDELRRAGELAARIAAIHAELGQMSDAVRWYMEATDEALKAAQPQVAYGFLAEANKRVKGNDELQRRLLQVKAMLGG